MKGKNKKILFVICIIMICVLGGIYVFNNVEIEEVDNIIPVEEISIEDENKIKIVGYFCKKDTEEIKAKELMIDRKMIENNMFQNILNNILINSSVGDEFININEDFCKLDIDKINLNNRCLEICFLNNINDFESLDIKNREIIINIIKNTMLEINEIDNVRFFFNNIEYIAV